MKRGTSVSSPGWYPDAVVNQREFAIERLFHWTISQVLALGIYSLANGNSYVSIGPVINVGKYTVIEAVQDVVAALFELRDEYIRFPETVAETTASIGTFQD